MKIIFAGTPPFAAAALRALHAAGHDIALVLTQPDRPAGRGMKLMRSAVARAAGELGLWVQQPSTLRDPNTQGRIAELSADIMIVAAYGLLLPQAVLDLPRRGCINVHASLLPRWRGAAPVQHAILAGDSTTGICIMQMDAGLDTGPVLLKREIAIQSNDTSATLLEKLTALGASAVTDAIADFTSLNPSSQSAEGATYAGKLSRADAPVDWRKSALEIDRQIRAFNPFPGAESSFDGKTLKIWQAVIGHGSPRTGTPGMVLRAAEDGILVACGDGALWLTEVQKTGGKRLPAAIFLLGTKIQPGNVLGTAESAETYRKS